MNLKLTQPNRGAKMGAMDHSNKQRVKTNEPANRRSNQLKFDWSGFLSNLMHENCKQKKSTSGPGNVNGSALCEKPYQLA